MERYAAAWAAGFFDGEGSIGMGQTNTNAAQLSVTASQKDRRPLARLHNHWGGSIDLASRGEVYRWRLGGWEKVEVFLRDIRPFLLVKAGQVDAIFKFMDSEREQGYSFGRGGRGNAVSAIQKIRREALRETLKQTRFGA